MIPERFVTESPERCGQLLDMLEPQARQADLVGSFALLVASAAFTIPFGRMTEMNHPLGRPERDLSRAIRGLRRYPFLKAPFWSGSPPTDFRYARIVSDPERAEDWRDAAGIHPLKSTEENNSNTVLSVIRNALAHGNVVYLDESGHETPGNRLHFIGFLSRHEDNRSHRVVIFGEEDFLLFLKAWIAWVLTFPPEREFVFVEAVG